MESINNNSIHSNYFTIGAALAGLGGLACLATIGTQPLNSQGIQALKGRVQLITNNMLMKSTLQQPFPEFQAFREILNTLNATDREMITTLLRLDDLSYSIENLASFRDTLLQAAGLPESKIFPRWQQLFDNRWPQWNPFFSGEELTWFHSFVEQQGAQNIINFLENHSPGELERILESIRDVRLQNYEKLCRQGSPFVADQLNELSSLLWSCRWRPMTPDNPIRWWLLHLPLAGRGALPH